MMLDKKFEIGETVEVLGGLHGIVTYIIEYTKELRYGVHLYDNGTFSTIEFYDFELKKLETTMGFKA